MFDRGAKYDVTDIYRDLRDMALSSGDSEIFESLGDEEIVAIVMDAALTGGAGCYTLVARADGSPSLYLSSGGGTIGLGQWPAMRERVLEYRAAVSKFEHGLSATKTFELPKPGWVHFYFVKRGGVLSGAWKQKKLLEERHPMSGLFNASQGLITLIRTFEEMQKTEPELVFAVRMNASEVVESLLEDGADPQTVDSDGMPVLAAAVRLPGQEMVDALLRAGANANVHVDDTNIRRGPLLCFAAAMGELGIVKSLLKAGVSVGDQEATGMAALHLAAHQDHAAVVDTLIEAGADIEQQEDSGYTPLMMAANSGSLETVCALLRKQAAVNATDKEGSTPIMFAAQHGHNEVVKALLAGGADPYIKGSHGFDAIALTAQHGREDTIAILKGGG